MTPTEAGHGPKLSEYFTSQLQMFVDIIKDPKFKQHSVYRYSPIFKGKMRANQNYIQLVIC